MCSGTFGEYRIFLYEIYRRQMRHFDGLWLDAIHFHGQDLESFDGPFNFKGLLSMAVNLRLVMIVMLTHSLISSSMHSEGLERQICSMTPQVRQAFIESSKLTTYGDEYFSLGGTKMDDNATVAYMKDFGFTEGKTLISGSATVRRNGLLLGSAMLLSGLGLLYLSGKNQGSPDNAVNLIPGIVLTLYSPLQFKKYFEGRGSRSLASLKFNEYLDSYFETRCK